MEPQINTKNMSNTFKRIELQELRNIFSKPAWYLDTRIQELVSEYFQIRHDDKSDEWLEERQSFITIVAELLKEEAIFLGTERGEGFNDTRRVKKVDGKFEWINIPNTVVIHHTSTPQDTSYEKINALHLMRLYIPLYMSKYPHFYGTDENPLPVESGHFSVDIEPRHQTFIGYHHLIKTDTTGSVSSIQTLRDEYMGFHAGSLATNVESYGISIVDDLLDSEPSQAVLEEIAGIIKAKIQAGVLTPDFKLIGHRDVIGPKGTNVDTECPGNRWNLWKPKLEKLLGKSID
jgi:hypothetical protein